ncbi:MAG: hypothetical protein Q8K79_21640 [Solirubrobacteraceae bacterium]|nr:hypothetical protein [Solirubrobacteraceae bacterium]
MEVRRLRTGEVATAAGAVALAAVLFIDWFGGQSGWSTMTVGRFLLALTIVLALTLVVVTLRAGAVSMALSAAVVTIGIGTLALLYLLLRVGIDEPGRNAIVSVDAGAYLGLLCLLVLLAGTWRALGDERKDSAISQRQTERVLGVRGPARPPPPARDAARDEPAS